MPERPTPKRHEPPPELLEKVRALALVAWHLGYAHGVQDAVAAASAGDAEYASWFKCPEGNAPC